MSSQLPSDLLEPDRRRVVYANSMMELVSSPLLGLELEEPSEDADRHLGGQHDSMRKGFHKTASARSPFYTPLREPIPVGMIIGKVDESRAREPLESNPGVFKAVAAWARKKMR